MAWRWPGDKLLSELIMVSLLTYICVNQPAKFFAIQGHKTSLTFQANIGCGNNQAITSAKINQEV